MNRNVGNKDRILRVLGGLALGGCALFAPLPLVVRVVAFGGMGAYVLFTAIAGSCLGYRLMGKSTCSIEQRP